MKSYTGIEQSKKLAEILPIESADMWWLYITAQGKHIAMMHEEPDPHYLARMESYGIKNGAIHCWSLAALLGFIPNYKLSSEHNYHTCTAETSFGEETVGWFDSPVDACYEMILKLNELKLLFAK